MARAWRARVSGPGVALVALARELGAAAADEPPAASPDSFSNFPANFSILVPVGLGLAAALLAGALVVRAIRRRS